MSPGAHATLRDAIAKDQDELLARWVELQLAATTLRRDLMNDVELRGESRRFIGLLQTALDSGTSPDVRRTEWSDVRDFVADLSRSRARLGFSPSETATFVFSLKQPLFERLRALKRDPATRDIPVVIVSAGTLPADEREALLELACDLLPKELLSRECVRAALDGALAREEPP